MNTECGMWFRLSKRLIPAATPQLSRGSSSERAVVEEVVAEEVCTEEPADFQRVRLITTKVKAPAEDPIALESPEAVSDHGSSDEASTSVESMVWDELDELKSRIRRL